MADHRAPSNPTPIPAERLTAGGPIGVDALDWALRIGAGLLVISALWFVIVVIRPLPGGEGKDAPAIPALASVTTHASSIEKRQQRLAALNDGGNMFASDRANWPVEIARATDTDPDPQQNGRNDPASAITIATTHEDLGSIEITTDAPSAIQKRLDLLKLRGVYAAAGDPIAMIGQRSNSRSEQYRVGDTFADGEWRVVAIDQVRDRVILNRSGLNYELTLYNTGTQASAGAEPRTAIHATNADGEVEIGFASLDDVATELREAGLPRDQINELIALSLEQDETDEPDQADDPDADADNEKAAIPPAMPPGMVQLFKAMAEGSRDVVSPTPVKTSDEPNEDESTPEQSEDDKQDDKK